MQIHGHDIGVCSWSLRPRDMRDLVAKVRQLGLSHVQVSFNGLVTADEATRDTEISILRESGLSITAGMLGFVGEDYTSIASIRNTGGLIPNNKWDERRATATAGAKLAKAVGVSAITMHVGFIPMSSGQSYGTIVERMCEVADAYAEQGVMLLMETGQETATELLQFLNDLSRKNVRVNFDPANMILYGSGDPIDAIRVLGRHIGHVHVKDALLSDQPRMKWGQEVPFGTGQVRPRRLLDALEAVDYRGPLVIERESSGDKTRDILDAIQALKEA